MPVQDAEVRQTRRRVMIDQLEDKRREIQGYSAELLARKKEVD